MPMTKSEMHSHQSLYHASISKSRLALRNGEYPRALEFAESSWQYIDGMMQYERKYEDRESFSIEAISIVLKMAPLLLQISSLTNLEVLLKNQKRIVKNSHDDLAVQLSAATELLWMAHRLWDYLEVNAGARQDELRRRLGGDQDQWRALAEGWEKMGLITRRPDRGSYSLFLSTQMNIETLAKCPGCGAVASAEKSLFLEHVACPTCHSEVSFVLLGTDSSTSQ